jgi:alpha-beta hydrolase superfamily lysophospholipase
VTHRPKLIDVTVPEGATAAVVVLHGGSARRGGPAAVSPTQLSVLRMIPIARRIGRAGAGSLAVFRLLNSVRGWDRDRTPVDDVRWALEEAAARTGRRLPTCLVGHSIGGRAALFAAGLPEVRSAVALAPWVYSSDAPTGLAGRRLLIVHGSDDRIASPERSLAVARGLRASTTVDYVRVAGGTHAMLRHRRSFELSAADFAVATLLRRRD